METENWEDPSDNTCGARESPSAPPPSSAGGSLRPPDVSNPRRLTPQSAVAGVPLQHRRLPRPRPTQLRPRPGRAAGSWPGARWTRRAHAEAERARGGAAEVAGPTMPGRRPGARRRGATRPHPAAIASAGKGERTTAPFGAGSGRRTKVRIAEQARNEGEGRRESPPPALLKAKANDGGDRPPLRPLSRVKRAAEPRRDSSVKHQRRRAPGPDGDCGEDPLPRRVPAEVGGGDGDWAQGVRYRRSRGGGGLFDLPPPPGRGGGRGGSWPSFVPFRPLARRSPPPTSPGPEPLESPLPTTRPPQSVRLPNFPPSPLFLPTHIRRSPTPVHSV